MRVFEPYIRLMKRHPVVLGGAAGAYLILAAGYFLVRQKTQMEYAWRAETRMLMHDFQDREETLERAVDSLSRSRGNPRFIKSIAFDEEWESSRKQVEVQRLLEYAEFAESKDDVKRAKALYEEALTVQSTLGAKYALGRLGYASGDIANCLQHWEALIKEDGTGRYPLLRFYTGIVLHEHGQDAESAEMLAEYLALTERCVPE